MTENQVNWESLSTSTKNIVLTAIAIVGAVVSLALYAASVEDKADSAIDRLDRNEKIITTIQSDMKDISRNVSELQKDFEVYRAESNGRDDKTNSLLEELLRYQRDKKPIPPR